MRAQNISSELKGDEKYAGMSLNGRSVKAHYEKLKKSTIADMGWQSPETMNLSGKAGDLTLVQENIRIICLEEEDEAAKKEAEKKGKEKLDKTVVNLLGNTEEKKKAARKRRFFDLDGTIVNSKGQVKVKVEGSDDVSSLTLTTTGK